MKKSRLYLFFVTFSIFWQIGEISSILLNTLFAILNVDANDLLKYLAFNGHIQASSVKGLGMRQFLAGPSKDGGD